MAYSELIKNFNRIRDYMREFYVYGFKSRDEYTLKSARSYDNERRRIESWMGDYMQFRQTPEGKNVFISVDSRISRRNPLYAAWKAKSFTDGDITLHFILLDILFSPEIVLNLNEIIAAADEYLNFFSEHKTFDASTIRKKLNEYITEGIIISEKRGKTMYYRRADFQPDCDLNVLDFFSEVAPCGVIGSYLLDKRKSHEGHFLFKHHYITAATDSEILCSLLNAISEKRNIAIETINRQNEGILYDRVVPLRIMIGVQSGRQYLMAYAENSKRIKSFRIDNILSVTEGDISEKFDELRKKLEGMLPHIWGVSTQSASGKRMDHVEFTVKYADNEQYIHKRLEREKRCGKVERLSADTSRFSADIFDANEIVPWMRTFICRITDYSFSNKNVEKRFGEDIESMYRLYGIDGGDGK